MAQKTFPAMCLIENNCSSRLGKTLDLLCAGETLLKVGLEECECYEKRHVLLLELSLSQHFGCYNPLTSIGVRPSKQL